MGHPKSLRTLARTLYIAGHAWAEIARQTGVAENTLMTWRKRALAEGDNWGDARAASHLAGSGRDEVVQAILNDYLTAHARTMQQIRETAEIPPEKQVEMLSRLADAMTKTMANVERAAPRLCKLAIAKEVLELLTDHLAEHHPQSAPVLLEALEPFGERLARHYG